MRRALELAARAEGSVSPRPPVGAVVVDDAGEVVGEGWTKAVPGPHAEAEALEVAGTRARGATLYVSLEPCTQSSVSTPCAELILAAGVKRVVAAARDPNPKINGRGFRKLRAAGVDVRTGVLAKAARLRIEPFAKWITTRRPFVTLKLAASLDGKVAAPDGTSQWITGAEARAQVHDLRRRADAVLVGAGTVATDDPSLTFRLDVDGVQPTRVVVDSSGRTPATAKVFDGKARLIMLATDETPVVGAWRSAGADVICMPRAEAGVDVEAGLSELGGRGLCHVLCEGGPTLAGSLVAAGLVDRFVIYLAPTFIGGEAPSLLGAGVKTLTDAWRLNIEHVTRVGEDIRIDASARAV